MEIKQIIEQLKKPFPASLHKERKLPGGGRWFFVSWQDVRDRLDEVCPEWQMAWGEPAYLGKDCIITCTITILGLSRSAPGNAPIELISSSGKDMSRGTPLERAIADAFKNAAEAWGVGRYLDEQSEDRKKFVVNYLKTHGDMRGYKYFTENEQLASGARGVSDKKSVPEPKQREPLLRPLYPHNNQLIKTIREVTGHTPDWIIERCKRVGGTKPEDTSRIWEVVYEMCGQHAVNQGQAQSLQGGYESIANAVVVAQNAGNQNLTQVAVDWLARHQAISEK